MQYHARVLPLNSPFVLATYRPCPYGAKPVRSVKYPVIGAGGNACVPEKPGAGAPISFWVWTLPWDTGTRTRRRVVKEPPAVLDAGKSGEVEGTNALLLYILGGARTRGDAEVREVAGHVICTVIDL
jgi:hypothetical protein